jgi:hypothetical protein
MKRAIWTLLSLITFSVPSLSHDIAPRTYCELVYSNSGANSEGQPLKRGEAMEVTENENTYTENGITMTTLLKAIRPTYASQPVTNFELHVTVAIGEGSTTFSTRLDNTQKVYSFSHNQGTVTGLVNCHQNLSH